MKTADSSRQIAEQDQSQNSPERWLDDHGDLLFRFAYLRVQDSHIAEELVQETLLNGLRAKDQFRGDSSVRTWLIAILRSEIAKHFRNQSREKLLRPEPGAAAAANPTESPLAIDQLLLSQIGNREFRTAVEREEFWTIVRRCFEQVPEHLLEAFLLRLASPESKIEELSAEIGIQASNFSVRLFRTRLMLRACLEKYWLQTNSIG